MLANKNSQALAAAQLAEQSVALQGLGAIEFLLFGTGSEELANDAEFRCGFAQSASANLNRTAEELARIWDSDEELRKNWQEPGAGNPLFRDDKEVLNAILGGIIHGLEGIRDVRIFASLGREKQRPDRPKSAPLWRSKQTMKSISTNLEGLNQLYLRSRVEEILPVSEAKLKASIKADFAQVVAAAERLDEPIADLLADPAKKQKLLDLAGMITSLKNRFTKEFVPAADLAIGFTIGDGDF